MRQRGRPSLAHRAKEASGEKKYVCHFPRMYPHRIRLRGPWEFEPLARAGGDPRPLPPGGRMIMPCPWREGGLTDFAGRVLFRRGFGYPGRLDATDHVWLTFAGIQGTARVWVNDQLLGQMEEVRDPFEFEITAFLRARNQLRVEVEAGDDSGGLWGEVALEIRCPAFLRQVQVTAVIAGDTADLHVAGEVVGTAERPLDFYVLLDDATILYTTLEPAAAGRPFHQVAAGLPPERWQPADRRHEIRMELVNGATVWYRIEQAFLFPAGGPSA
jgi:hypothetical protein